MAEYKDFFKKSHALKVRQKSKRHKIKFSWSLVIVAFGLVGASASIFGLTDEQLFGLMDKVEFKFLGSAMGEEKKESHKEDAKPVNKEEKTAEAKVEGGEKTAVEGEGEKKVAAGPKRDWSDEEVNLFNKLEARKQQIDQKNEDLQKMEEELHKQKEEINKRLVQLEQTRAKIANQLEERVKNDTQKVESLISIYEKMKPAQAAKIIEGLNEDLAVDLITKMKTKSSSAILDVMDSQKAKRLSEKFTGYKDLAKQ